MATSSPSAALPPFPASSAPTSDSPLPPSQVEGRTSVAPPTAPPSSSAKREPLPLGWTQVRRRKRSRDASSTDGEDPTSYCCDDPSCRRASQPVPPAAKTDDGAAADRVTGSTRLRGRAVFCLHDIETSWFQGHFLPHAAGATKGGSGGRGGGATIKPLGLLAVNRTDVDECLQCADGGYRELDLTVFSFGKGGGGRGNNDQQRGRKVTIERVQGTGGDMLRLRGDANVGGGSGASAAVSFDAERILAGRRAVPYVEKYFVSLLKQLRREEPEGALNEAPVLELLPDCAIVIGNMELTVPSKVLGTEKRQVDDEGWMSD